MSNNPFGAMGMGGLGGMMKQVKQLQDNMAKAQEELETAQVEASAGGGMVKVIVTGKRELVDLIIDPQCVDPDDVEMLQDLVCSAVREALAKAKKLETDTMSQATGGITLPGM